MGPASPAGVACGWGAAGVTTGSCLATGSGLGAAGATGSSLGAGCLASAAGAASSAGCSSFFLGAAFLGRVEESMAERSILFMTLGASISGA